VEREGEKRAAWAKATSSDGLPVCSVPAKDCGAVGEEEDGSATVHRRLVARERVS
jgi:hypothetical protein